MSPNPRLNSQPIPCPPFQWSQLTLDQQRQLSQLLARLLTQYLAGSQKVTMEVLHEQSSQDL